MSKFLKASKFFNATLNSNLLKPPKAWSLFIIRISFFILFFDILWAVASPFSLRVLHPGLDASWAAVIAEAHALGLFFGKDIAFTAGPLSSLYFPWLNDNLFLVLFIWLVYGLYGAYVLTRLCLGDRPKTTLICALLTAITLIGFPLARDFLFLLPPLLFVQAYILGIRNYLFLLVSCFLFSALTLGKFSAFPLAVAVCLLVDGYRLLTRKLPGMTLALIAIFIITYGLAGEPVGGLLGYFGSSLSVVSGYSVAMSFRGDLEELILWVLLAGAVVTITFLRGYRSESVAPASPEAVRLGLLRSFTFLGFLWIGLKAGFVRHDAHSVIAWSNLVFVALLLVLEGVQLAKLDRKSYVSLGIWATALVFGLWLNHDLALGHPLSPTDNLLTRGVVQIQTGIKFLQHPTEWLQQKQLEKAQAFEQLRQKFLLPQFSGTVDMLPSAQAEVLANRLNYRPRPTIQEYTTYSKALIERNRQFFLSPTAPDYLLFEPGSIDDRHPASAEGSLWPLFLRTYEPVDQVRSMLVLKKRTQPLPEILKSLEETTVQFDQGLPLPAVDQPLFVKIDIGTNAVGKLISLAFKPSKLRLILDYPEDIPQEKYRLIPDMAREGMVLSPTIKRSQDYYWLAAAEPLQPNLRHPSQMTIHARGGPWMYRPTIKVSFYAIDQQILKAHRPAFSLKSP
jgi:hypothetical protein